MAAVDIGANNLATVVTSDGDHQVFHGRPCFHQFYDLTEQIAERQSELPDNRYSSHRICELYRRRNRQRDHARDALVRHLGDWLAERGVTTLYVGALDDVRERHWSATVNEKTDLFWAHGRFRDRLADVAGAVSFLHQQADVSTEVGPMARPAACGQNRPRDTIVCFEWDDHRW